MSSRVRDHDLAVKVNVPEGTEWTEYRPSTRWNVALGGAETWSPRTRTSAAVSGGTVTVGLNRWSVLVHALRAVPCGGA